MEIDISEMIKPEVLAALYNNARAQGMGLLHFNPQPMTTKEASELLDESQYFDYLKGRVMKINLGTDVLRSHLYDRDNGHGAAREAIKHLSGYKP